MEIRDYQAGNETHILALFQQVFKTPMKPEYWQWRFANNPCGKFMIKLMWDGDILAGHYAASPVNLLIEEKKVLSALSMTTMTHPDYGGQGIFGKLAESLYADGFKNQQLAAIWGFPNNNSHYGFIKNLQWQDFDQIPSFGIDVKKIPEGIDAPIQTADNFSTSHYKAFLEVTKGWGVKVDRSPDYLNWRHIQNPSNNYVVFESTIEDKTYYAVTKVFRSFSSTEQYEVDLVELMFPPDIKLLQGLLGKIKQHYSNLPLLKFNCWLPIKDKKHILLEKLGFINEAPITYAGVHLIDPQYPSVYQPQNWFYCMGDSDIY